MAPPSDPLLQPQSVSRCRRRWCCFGRREDDVSSLRTMMRRAGAGETTTESIALDDLDALIADALEGVDAAHASSSGRLSAEQQMQLDEAWELWSASKQEDAMVALKGLCEKSSAIKKNILQDPRYMRLKFQVDTMRAMNGFMDMSPEESTLNWLDCSVQGVAQCFIHLDADKPPGGHTLTALMSGNMEDVANGASFITSVESSITRGARLLHSPITFLNDMPSWPSWFPLCNGATVLKKWTDEEMLVHLQFGFMAFKADQIIYLSFRNRLDDTEEPYIEGIQGSPPPSTDGEETVFLGVPIPPPKKGVNRLHVPFQRIRGYPTGWNSMRYVVLTQSELNIRAAEWIAKRLWKLLCSKMSPLLFGKFNASMKNGLLLPEFEPQVAQSQPTLERIYKQLEARFGPPPDGVQHVFT